MRASARGLLLGLGALFAAVAMCAALPAPDPRCGTFSAGAAMLGTCGMAQGGLSRDLMIVALVTAAAILAVVAVLVARQAAAHHRLSEHLRGTARPTVIAGEQIGLVQGRGAAVVAGLWRPRIYCSEDLLTSLDDDELMAVLLHERHHALSHAPAKLVVLSALSGLVGRMRAGSAWIEGERSRIEIAADDHALTNGATRAVLARAILKLSDAAPTLMLAAFATATELRMRALIGDGHQATDLSHRFVPAALVAAALVVVACSGLSVL